MAITSQSRPTSGPSSTSAAYDPRRTPGPNAPGPADWETVFAEARKLPSLGGVSRNRLRTAARHALGAHEPSVSRETSVDVPLTGLSSILIGSDEFFGNIAEDLYPKKD